MTRNIPVDVFEVVKQNKDASSVIDGCDGICQITAASMRRLIENLNS